MINETWELSTYAVPVVGTGVSGRVECLSLNYARALCCPLKISLLFNSFCVWLFFFLSSFCLRLCPLLREVPTQNLPKLCSGDNHNMCCFWFRHFTIGSYTMDGEGSAEGEGGSLTHIWRHRLLCLCLLVEPHRETMSLLKKKIAGGAGEIRGRIEK